MSGTSQVREEVLRAQAKRLDGTYGLCDRCGRPIPEGRLEALPWATTHVVCDPTDRSQTAAWSSAWSWASERARGRERRA